MKTRPDPQIYTPEFRAALGEFDAAARKLAEIAGLSGSGRWSLELVANEFGRTVVGKNAQATRFSIETDSH